MLKIHRSKYYFTCGFKVIDQYVFDKNGFQINEITKFGVSLSGSQEVCIVPVPDNCNQFYIITNQTQDNAFNSSFEPYYVKVDLEATGGAIAPLGAFIPVGSLPISLAQPGTYSYYSGPPKTAGIGLMASTLRPNNTRFLFVATGTGILRYIINSQDIQFDGVLYDNGVFGNGIAGLEWLAESEVIDYDAQNYRIAVPMLNGLSNFSPSIVFIADINKSTGILDVSTIKIAEIISTAPVPENNLSEVKGVEFSPNGRYLYINRYEVIDATAPVNDPGGLLVYDCLLQNMVAGTSFPGDDLFQNSQLELGYDGSIYMVNSTTMARIQNPDTPLTPGWNSSFTTGLNYNFTAVVGGTPAPGNINSAAVKQSYLLPDQIDGEDYLATYTTANLCCKKIDGYEVDFTADVGTSVWNVNGANPFNAVQEVRIDGELLFPAGATVFINNMTFRFEENARMTIAKNAKVYLNNTLLTSNECDGVMWQGVAVDGSPGSPQIYPYTNQGYLSMVNGSEISNAQIGVTLHKRTSTGATLWNNVGGIITANNSTFRNNIKDVEFLTYNNANKSRFDNCTFITDNQLNDGSILAEHVSLFKVKGVIFGGCDFKNTTTSGQFYTDQHRGAGISSIEAYYKVTYLCNSNVPLGQVCTNKNRGSFEGLFYGVYALGINAANSIEVKYNDFINNTRGAYFGALDKVVFVNNNINVGPPIVWSYGAYFENSTGYKIQNNNFITSETGTTYGLLIANSNNNQTARDANEVYRNTFTGLDYGAVAFRGNVKLDLDAQTGNVIGVTNETGLTYKCNTFSGSKINDIGFIQGISDNQGACSVNGVFAIKAPANNMFSAVLPSNGDFWNYDNTLIGTAQLYETDYFDPSPNGTDNTTPQGVNPINTNVIQCGTPMFNMAVGCPLNRFDGTGKLALKNKMSSFQQRVVSVQSFLAEVDEEVLEEIVEVQEEILEDGIDDFDDWEDFAEDLIDESPFVKDSHLIALFDLPIPGGVLKEILLANSPLPKTVLDVLTASPYPQSIKNQINNAQTGGLNARIQKENEIGYLQREQSLYFDEILREFIHDTTIVGGLDSVIVMLKGRNSGADGCRLVAYYIETKQYIKAQEQLDFLRLTDFVKYDSFCKFYELLLSFEQTINNCYVIKTDIVRKNKLEAFAAGNPKNKICYKAQALLNEVYKNRYFEQEPIFPMVKSAWIEENAVEEILASKMAIYPNPTNDILTIELLLDREEVAKVTLYDAMGRIALSKQVTNLKSYISVGSLENGIYILIVELPNGEKLTEKVMIRK